MDALKRRRGLALMGLVVLTGALSVSGGLSVWLPKPEPQGITFTNLVITPNAFEAGAEYQACAQVSRPLDCQLVDAELIWTSMATGVDVMVQPIPASRRPRTIESEGPTCRTALAPDLLAGGYLRRTRLTYPESCAPAPIVTQGVPVVIVETME